MDVKGLNIAEGENATKEGKEKPDTVKVVGWKRSCVAAF